MQLSEGFEKALGMSKSLRVCFELIFRQTFKFLWRSMERRDCPKSSPPTMRHL